MPLLKSLTWEQHQARVALLTGEERGLLADLSASAYPARLNIQRRLRAEGYDVQTVLYLLEKDGDADAPAKAKKRARAPAERKG